MAAVERLSLICNIRIIRLCIMLTSQVRISYYTVHLTPGSSHEVVG